MPQCKQSFGDMFYCCSVPAQWPIDPIPMCLHAISEGLVNQATNSIYLIHLLINLCRHSMSRYLAFSQWAFSPSNFGLSSLLFAILFWQSCFLQVGWPLCRGNSGKDPHCYNICDPGYTYCIGSSTSFIGLQLDQKCVPGVTNSWSKDTN